MRLAFISSKAESKNLAAIALRHPKIFDYKVYIDGQDLTENQNSESCLYFIKLPKSRMRIEKTSCSDETQKFLCEDVKLADAYEDTVISSDKLDVKATFLTYLGDYGELLSIF